VFARFNAAWPPLLPIFTLPAADLERQVRQVGRDRADGAVFGGRRRNGGRIVPAALRNRNVEGVVRLRLGDETLRRLLGAGQFVGIQARGDLVALLGGFAVALRRCQSEPLVRLCDVLVGAEATGAQDAEIILAVGDAMLRRLAEPGRCGGVVRLAVDAFGL
jgi:hypothetical protein